MYLQPLISYLKYKNDKRYQHAVQSSDESRVHVSDANAAKGADAAGTARLTNVQATVDVRLYASFADLHETVIFWILYIVYQFYTILVDLCPLRFAF